MRAKSLCRRTRSRMPSELALAGQFGVSRPVVRNALQPLVGKGLVVKLPRTPGRKDPEYMHLFCGPVDVDAHVAEASTARPAATQRGGVAELTERVERLEAEVAELRKQLGLESED